MPTKQRKIVSHLDEIQTALDKARSSTKHISDIIYSHGPILGEGSTSTVDEAAIAAHEALWKISIADRTLRGDEHIPAVLHALKKMEACLPKIRNLRIYPNVLETKRDIERFLDTRKYYTVPADDADDAPETANTLPKSFTREDFLQHLREKRGGSHDAAGMSQTHPKSSTRTPFTKAMIEAGKDRELTVVEAARITGLNERVISIAIDSGRIASNGGKGESCRIKLGRAVEFADSYKPESSEAAVEPVVFDRAGNGGAIYELNTATELDAHDVERMSQDNDLLRELFARESAAESNVETSEEQTKDATDAAATANRPEPDIGEESQAIEPVKGKASETVKPDTGRPKDLMTTIAATFKYQVTDRTLRRHIAKEGLKSYRKGDNGMHRFSEADVADRWAVRPNYQQPTSQ